jgi:hypothetical protein
MAETRVDEQYQIRGKADSGFLRCIRKAQDAENRLAVFVDRLPLHLSRDIGIEHGHETTCDITYAENGLYSLEAVVNIGHQLRGSEAYPRLPGKVISNVGSTSQAFF